MSSISHCVGSCLEADFLFPCGNDGGGDVFASPKAVELARGLLGAPEGAALVWDLPDVFSVPYDSSRIGSASFEGRTVEFFFDDAQ